MNKNFIFISLLLLTFASCTKQKSEIIIGFSHSDFSRDWGTLMYQEMINEISLHYEDHIKLITRDAHRSSLKQNQDIMDLYNMGINALIIFPIDSTSSVPVIEGLYDKGLPVIVVDRKLSTSKYSVFLSNDNLKIGFEAGNYVVNKLKFKGKLLEILGTEGSSTSLDRSNGFREAVMNYPGITGISRIYGDWLANVTEYKTDSVFRSGFVPDLIYAHTDLMAQSARGICEKYHINPVIIGIDGLTVKNGGVDMVLKKQIDVTFYNDPGGNKAIECAMDLLMKKNVEKNIILKTFPIDLENAESIKVLDEIQSKQFERVKLQQTQIKKMFGTIQSKNMLIYLSFTFIFILGVTILIFAYFNKQKQKFISLIKVQKEKIELQIEEEKNLSNQLLNSNKLLEDQSEEILYINDHLEKYRNHLEQLVQERTMDLESALEKAKESDKLKTSFLSNLSHEIRTPLNSIVGFTELLSSSKSAQEEKKYFQSIIVQSSNQLLNSINLIVEIARFSSQKIEFLRAPISSAQLFKEMYNELPDVITQLLEIKKDEVEFKLIPPPNVIFESDIYRIKQVMTYLIDNALKFTGSGYVHAGLEIVQQHSVRFYVKDSGVGILKENQQIIFEKFRKIEDDTGVLFRGIGLGLAIAKQIVEQLGGSLSVESEFGKGSEFSFILQDTIKRDIDEARAKKQENIVFDLEGKTILIAEDEDSNYAYIETLLRKKNPVLIRAKNGLETINRCISNPPDFILMDIRMPVMDGINAFRKIKSLLPAIKIMAITSYAMISEKEKILKVGFDSYLAKPFTQSGLLKMIEEMMSSDKK